MTDLETSRQLVRQTTTDSLTKWNHEDSSGSRVLVGKVELGSQNELGKVDCVLNNSKHELSQSELMAPFRVRAQ